METKQQGLPEPEDQANNTNGVASVLENGDLSEVQMILGSRTSVKPAGVIRPGIKCPLASCSPQQRAKYEEMLEDNASFDAIDQALLAMEPKGSNKRTCLRPSNADHFTVRSADFRSPGDAERILRAYADPDGKVRRFPVWFAKGELPLVIPHNFRGFGTGGFVKFSSFYRGADLLCRYVPATVQNPGRDDYQERPCPGLTDPEECPDYKAKRCRFGGLYRCNVPVVSGIGEIIIPTNSWNGLAEAVGNLRRVREVFGRFHGLHNRAPFLQVAKVKTKVRHEGKLSEQWIITVEPTVPMLELAAANDPEEVAARARAAVAALRGPAPAAPRQAPPPATEPTAPAEEPEDLLADAHAAAMAEAESVLGPAAPAAGEVTPEVEQAVAAIKTRCEGPKVGLQWEHVAAWICREWKVVRPEAASLQQLREVFAEIQKRLADRAEFTATIADCFRMSQPAPELDSDDGFDPNDDVPF